MGDKKNKGKKKSTPWAKKKLLASRMRSPRSRKFQRKDIEDVDIRNADEPMTAFVNLSVKPALKFETNNPTMANTANLDKNNAVKSMNPALNLETEVPNITTKTLTEDEYDLNIEISPPEAEFQALTGRRIVDLNYLFSQIQEKAHHSGLFDCKAGYFVIVGEKRVGLTSLIKLKCKMCKEEVIVRSENPKDSENVNLNIAATTGIIGSGIGYSQFEEICSAMNVPIFGTKFYSVLQNDVYNRWEKIAAKCMEEAIEKEKEIAISEGRLVKGYPVIDVSVDGAWCARSYGNNYRALSGAAAIIGRKTGEILYLGIKNKYCLVCSRAEKKGSTVAEHICFKNYEGSSSAMESEIIVEGFKTSIDMYGIIYGRMIADGDSSTYSNILKANPYRNQNIVVEKIECKNHILRNFCKKLRAMQTETKYPLVHRKTLSNHRIMSMRKAILKSLIHHNGSESKIKVSLLHKDITNVVAHSYGDHSMCQDYFCNQLGLINTSDWQKIQNSAFLFRINAIINTVASKARSLVENVDTNSVERFNSVIAKFVGGKRINFSQRKGYQGRCAAAVVSFNKKSAISLLQKNILNKSPRGKVKEIEQAKERKRKLNMDNPHKKIRKLSFGHRIQNDYGISCSEPDLPQNEMKQAEEDFLKNLKVLVADKENIERSTVLQRDSSLWMDLRKKILTASNFGPVCKRRQASDTSTLVKSILYKKNLAQVASIAHGIENEQQALQQLQKQENLIIQPCGLHIDNKFDFIGASPDGLVAEDTIVEIKCVYTAFKKGLKIQEAIENNKIQILRYCKKKANTRINTSSNWYFQIQGQLHVTGRQKCILGIWLGEKEPVYVINIERDDEFWSSKMEPKLINFYLKCLMPEIINPRYSRGMPIRSIKLDEKENVSPGDDIT